MISKLDPTTDLRTTHETRIRRPGLSLLGRLSVGQKLALSAATFALPIVVIVSLLASEQQQALNFVRSEQRGAQYLPSLETVLKNMQLHRRASSKFLNGDAEQKATLTSLDAQIDQGIAQLESTNTGLGDEFQLGADIGALKTAWTRLKSQVSNQTITADKSTDAHTALLSENITQAFANVSHASQISLDPSVDGYYLGLLSTERLPDALPTIGVTRTLGSAAITAGTPLTEVQRTEYLNALDQAQGARHEVDEAVKYLLPALPQDVRAQYEAAYKQFDDNNAILLKTFEENILAPGGTTISAADFKKISDSSTSAQFDFFERTISLLGQRLTDREASETRQRLLSLGLSLLAVLLASALLFLIARAITRPLGQLADASTRLAGGDLNASVPVTTRDEVGTVSGAFNSAVAQLRENEVRNEQARVEAQQLQQNIGQFLDVTMDIAEGDLTKRGRVTEDVLGNVVDSINLMTEELGQVLRDVQRASNSVTGGSVDMLATTSDIQASAQLTANEAQQVARQVQQVIVQIRDMATSAQASADSARQALLASQQGQQAVAGTLEGMQNIRREVQGVAKRIKGLGDRSLEIQEIVDTISQIASQTNLLALNAAIEAAGAGEAGSRFAIVADEVRKLADNSAQATGRIANLIRTVQTEIQDVIVTVEDGTREVEQGYRIAGTAGERLREIGTLTQQSAQLAESISNATQAQVQGMEQVGGAVQEIASIADRSRSSVERGRVAAEQLQNLASQLNSGLARFRLPS
ncbi:methyl-accepting chemotaxis protein [Deinococcus aquiradiocola]|uniref:Methyl-accepting chemotaxis protein n=1 Tax=Deinococcus aquiradiocola TaxID=393059 RepID=A0A917UN52_9DEIO|nr:methyl-accepting chemotaxis protein [Deinococcus aquiradiocola]GGJ69807.1 methyl-accepting chemotaxis protein [Deinococcus aquiradiocola]